MAPSALQHVPSLSMRTQTLSSFRPALDAGMSHGRQRFIAFWTSSAPTRPLAVAVSSQTQYRFPPTLHRGVVTLSLPTRAPSASRTSAPTGFRRRSLANTRTASRALSRGCSSAPFARRAVDMLQITCCLMARFAKCSSQSWTLTSTLRWSCRRTVSRCCSASVGNSVSCSAVQPRQAALSSTVRSCSPEETYRVATSAVSSGMRAARDSSRRWGVRLAASSRISSEPSVS
mmetsp:Transcript_47741/g.140991  ORF Transcript_47741/g.140991 Transcript_47741/m.140991 type:complete len:231 (-) Transcript_47741:3537-4229(-)